MYDIRDFHMVNFFFNSLITSFFGQKRQSMSTVHLLTLVLKSCIAGNTVKIHMNTSEKWYNKQRYIRYNNVN